MAVVLIRGGGEVASAIAHKLTRSGFLTCLTEIPSPLAIHRGTSFSEAIYEGEKEVDGITAKLISNPEHIVKVWRENKLPLIIDPDATIKDFLQPDIIIDAIMAKKNLGTKITDAELVIGLGPGFKTGRDCHMIVETNNSEHQGKVIIPGEAESDTRIPLEIKGLTFERVLRAPKEGILRLTREMGDIVKQNDIVASVNDQPIISQIDGLIRALLKHGVLVRKGMKLGEIDPRPDPAFCTMIRPKMRSISGGVLEAIMMHLVKEKTTNT